MEVQKTELPGSKLELMLQLTAAEVGKVYTGVFQELSNQGGIPGFRPGKAPAAILRRRIGEEHIRDMAWMRLVEEYYPKALEENEIDPIEDPTFPDVEDLDFGEGKPLEFTVSVVVRPTPSIAQYKGLKVYCPSAEVTEEDIEQAINNLLEGAAVETETDREEVQEGDVVTAKVTVDTGEEPEEGEEPSEETQDFIIGSGRYEPALDVAMVGKKIGDTVSVEHEYAEDYGNDELAGSKVTVSATIEKIVERKLPELTDEFAKEQGDFENVEALRAGITEQLAKRLQDQARQESENNALAAILAGTEIDLPDSLVARAAAGGLQNFQQTLASQGMTLEAFTEMAGVTEEQIRSNEAARAEASLKLDLTLAEIRKAESIELEDADLDAEIERFAEASNMDAAFVRQTLEVQEGLEDQLRERALRNKIISFIVDNCEVEEVPRDSYADVKQAERDKLVAQVEARVGVEAAEAGEAEADADAQAAEEAEEAETATEE